MAPAAFVLFVAEFGGLLSFSILAFALSRTVSFFAGVACDDFDSFGVLFEAELRFPPCELDDSESELDEFESESLVLPLDDDEPELLQLVPDVLTDWKTHEMNN